MTFGNCYSMLTIGSLKFLKILIKYQEGFEVLTYVIFICQFHEFKELLWTFSKSNARDILHTSNFIEFSPLISTLTSKIYKIVVNHAIDNA